MKEIRKVKLDENLQSMLISSIRYAVGRRTYMVGWTVEYIIPLLPDFSDKNLIVIWRDLERSFLEPEYLGDSCDIKDWACLYREVHKELSKRDIDYEFKTRHP